MPILGTVASVAGGFVAGASKSAISFLSIIPKYLILIPAIVLAWTILIGGTVQDLNIDIPFTSTVIDLETPTDILANQIAAIIDMMPFMAIVFSVFIWGLQIKIVLLLIELIWKVLSLFVQA